MSFDYQSVVDEILKPKTKMAKIKATGVWTQFCDKKIPIKINDIIQKIGVPTRQVESLSFDGITKVSSDGTFCILYNKDRPIVRKRFTLAHEIGHIVLEHVSIFGDCTQHSKRSQEVEANAFASELLVPAVDLKQFIKKQERTIQEVMDRYWVSKEVSWIAIMNNKLSGRIKL